MANQTGRPIAPARKLVAWIIGTIAFFVIALGLGMSSSPVAFFGLAVLAIAIAVALMPVQRRGGRATVAGNAEVRSITAPPAAGAYGRATVELIVVAPGFGTFETTVREPRVPVEKWPVPGATVPITVDVDDTRRVRISWRDAPVTGPDDLSPPPQPASRAEPDDLDDELFGDVDEAPWQGRQDDWDVDTTPMTPSSGSRAASAGYARTATPVVVRDTPTGTIVEGHVVDADEEPAPLPRRAGSAHRFDSDATDPEEPVDRPDPGPDQGTDPIPAGPDALWQAHDAASPGFDSPGHPHPGSDTSGSAERFTHSDPGPAAVMTEPEPGPAGGSRPPSASVSGRSPGSRPSPRPRGGSATATAERDPSGGTTSASPTATTTVTATATPVAVTPPAQRTPQETRPDPAADIDLDLDGPPTSSAATTTTAPARSSRQPSSAGERRSTPTEPDPATRAAHRSAAEPVSPAEPISPTDRRTPADPVSPAGRRPAGAGRIPGPPPPPPPVARSADAPAPPPPPTARSGQADTPPPPPPSRSSRGDGGAREQQIWARPPQAAPSQPAPPTAATPPPAQSFRSAGVNEPTPSPAPPQPAPASQAASGRGQPLAARPAPAPRHAAADERWAPPAGQAAVPPNVEARPLGSRTRFFLQPGDEPTVADDPRPVPERTPSSTVAAPSPMSAPPAAPEPDRPFPSAPPPAVPPPTTSRPGIEQIDIPLGPDFPLRNHEPPAGTNAEPPAEASRRTAARADGTVAPPSGEQSPGGEQPTPRPSALRDGILGVAVGRAAVSPDAFPTPHLDDVPAPGEEQRRGGPWGDLNARPDEHAGDVLTGYPSARPSAAGSIHGVGITVLVTDLERSTEFYRDTLGFHEIDNGDGSAVLASGDTRLVLRTVHNLSAEAGRLIYLNLEVGDIEAVHAELRDKGVKFVHSPRPVNRGDKLELWSATFRDPDNHNIAITQWRAIR